MRKKANKKPFSIYKLFIYVVLIALAVSIIVPVAWVFMASIKQNSEFYGNPWKLPAGFYFQNFIDAWTTAVSDCTAGCLCAEPFQIQRKKDSECGIYGGPVYQCKLYYCSYIPDVCGWKYIAQKDWTSSIFAE